MFTVNLAVGKPTAQSSTNNDSNASGVSGNAVDGNADPDFNNGHCSHTKKKSNPSWWRVDLDANLVPVGEIYIVNRLTSDPSLQLRNKGYKITFGEYQCYAQRSVKLSIEHHIFVGL